MPINMNRQNSKMTADNIYNDDKDGVYDPLDFEVEQMKS